MKNQIHPAVYVTAIIAIIVVALFFLYPVIYSQPTTITTQGSAQQKVMPDTASVYVYTQVIDVSAESAKNKNSGIMDKLGAALAKIGIAKSDIETDQYSISPNYNWSDGRNEILGYTLTQSTKITTKNFDNVGKIVDSAVNAGALISYINFEISVKEQNALKAQMLADASSDARLKADSIANGLGKKISKVLSVQANDYSYVPYPLYRAESGIAVKEALVDITPKKLDINAQVSATFEIN